MPLPFVGGDSEPQQLAEAEKTSVPSQKTEIEAPQKEQLSGDKAVEQALQHALRTSDSSRLPNVSDVVDNPALTGVAPLPTTHEPQGKAAARLAAKTQPSLLREQPQSALATGPAPLAEAQQTFKPGDIPLPAPLPAPVAEAGQEAPRIANPKPAVDNEGVWDMLGLTKLPIPTLGSVKTAHAAAQSMPLPQTGTANGPSPFAPREQSAPIVMPGAPDIPANIPTGQELGGEPLPARGMSNTPAGAMPSTPSASSAGQGGNLYDAQELARQQQDVLMLKQQMDDRLKELRSSEKRVQKMLEEAKGLEDKQLKGLILMYINMKPKTAAQAIEKMEERIAAQILKGMTPKQSGEILSYTNPQVTAKLTELLSRMRIQ